MYDVATLGFKITIILKEHLERQAIIITPCRQCYLQKNSCIFGPTPLYKQKNKINSTHSFERSEEARSKCVPQTVLWQPL